MQFADRFRTIVCQRIVSVLVDDSRNRQKFFKVFGDAYRAAARATASMRG